MKNKFQFLIPVRDNDGQLFPADDWEWLQTELVTRFGGWTVEGQVTGAWRDAESGVVFQDVSWKYVVVVDAAQEPELMSFLLMAKIRYRQIAPRTSRPRPAA
jgi:hypothetical protein